MGHLKQPVLVLQRVFIFYRLDVRYQRRTTIELCPKCAECCEPAVTFWLTAHQSDLAAFEQTIW